MRLLLVLGSLTAFTAVGCSPSVDVGTVVIQPFTVHVKRDDEFSAGGTTSFAIKLDSGTKVDSVQAWFGLQNDPTRAKGSFDETDGDFDTVVRIPTPIPAGALLWITIISGGVESTGALPVR